MLGGEHKENHGRVPVNLNISQEFKRNKDDTTIKLDLATKSVLEEIHRISISLRQGLKDSYNDEAELKTDVDKYTDAILWVGQFDLLINI